VFGPCRQKGFPSVCTGPRTNGQCPDGYTDCRLYFDYPEEPQIEEDNWPAELCTDFSVNGLTDVRDIKAPPGSNSSACYDPIEAWGKDPLYCPTKCSIFVPNPAFPSLEVPDNKNDVKIPVCQDQKGDALGVPFACMPRNLGSNDCVLEKGGQQYLDFRSCGAMSFTLKSYGICRDPTTGLCMREDENTRRCPGATQKYDAATAVVRNSTCSGCAFARGRVTEGTCKHPGTSICLDFGNDGKCLPGTVACN
jgi:hypothetical protein